MSMASNSTLLPRGTRPGRVEFSLVAKRGMRRSARAVASPDKPKSSGVSIQIDEPFRKPASKTGIPAEWPSVEEMTSEAIVKAMQQVWVLKFYRLAFSESTENSGIETDSNAFFVIAFFFLLRGTMRIYKTHAKTGNLTSNIIWKLNMFSFFFF